MHDESTAAIHASLGQIRKQSHKHLPTSLELAKIWVAITTLRYFLRSETNGIAERVVRRRKKKTPSALVQFWSHRRMERRSGMLLLLA